MKNSEQLAYPVTTVEHTGFSQTGDKIYSSHTEGGLTKREMFAMAAMQGLLSNAPFVQALGLDLCDRCYHQIKHNPPHKETMAFNEYESILEDLDYYRKPSNEPTERERMVEKLALLEEALRASVEEMSVLLAEVKRFSPGSYRADTTIHNAKNLLSSIKEKE